MKLGWIGRETNNPLDTIQLGKTFASYLDTGDIIALKGGLAAGKTTFIKGVLKGLDFEGLVTSPTFTLINEYDAKLPVVHIDCYREENLKRWINIGINDYLFSDKVILIEWPGKIQRLLPAETISLQFNHVDIEKRKITLTNK